MRVPVEVEPDPEIPGCGSIFVPLEVGDLVARVVLDTGSPSTTLTEVPSSARAAGTGTAEGVFGRETVAQWLVESISLGSLRAGPLTVDLIDRHPERHPFVGLDVIGAGPWQLDLADRTLTTDITMANGSGLTVTETGHLLSAMSWPGVRATALFDTGAGITLIDRRFTDEHPELFEAAGSTIGTDSAGVRHETDLAQVLAYEIEGIAFQGHLVAIADLPALPDQLDVVIGYPTIVQARWSIDIPGRQWQVER